MYGWNLYNGKKIIFFKPLNLLLKKKRSLDLKSHNQMQIENI